MERSQILFPLPFFVFFKYLADEFKTIFTHIYRHTQIHEYVYNDET